MSMRNSMSMVLGAGALLLISGLGAYAQLQTGTQQACLNGVNKNGAAVFKTQGKAHLGCLKGAGKGVLTGTAQACLTADAKGAVAKAQSKTTAAAAKSCGTPPSFGFTSAATVNSAAKQANLDLVGDIYGPNLDAAVLSCASSKAGCGCQQKISKDLEALAAAKLATFVGCKKSVLKAGASSAAALGDCVNNGGMAGSIAQDTKGKIGKVFSKLTDDIIKACDTPNVTASAFPGACNGVGGGGALASCLDFQVECRVCQAINEMDALFVNCDLFDNGVADASCESGTGPTPTPTPTATATPGILGALTATNGRFNYNLTLGLPGANAACNSNFPGTHACTYAELQVAEAGGALVGLKDIGNNTVTGFWAIDPAADPLTTQCYDDASFPCPGGVCSGPHAWEYGTAHTPSRGQKVALTNGTGVLGPLQTGLQCNFSGSSWVGCCL